MSVKDVVMGMIKENGRDLDSSSCSSIGVNSDDEDKSGEAQSCYRFDDDNINNNGNGSSFDAIEALEEALPIRRGISSFYDGKSKSFTSLADAWLSPATNNIAKPENAYTRRRRNLIASTIGSGGDKNRAFHPRNNGVAKISKKASNGRATTLAFAVAMSNTASNSGCSEHNHVKQQSQLSSFGRNLSALRSFSMADLHQCASTCALSSSDKPFI